MRQPLASRLNVYCPELVAMKYFICGLLMLAVLPVLTRAEIEKHARPNDSDMQLYWWPRLSPPSGWQMDEEASYRYAFKALCPVGRTFSDAEAVMYAKANFKPKTPEVKTLSALIDQDIAAFKAENPSLTVVAEAGIRDGDGKSLRVFRFYPTGEGNWERVAYGEEDEFFLVFSVSSRSKKGLLDALPAFKELIASYRAKDQ